MNCFLLRLFTLPLNKLHVGAASKVDKVNSVTDSTSWASAASIDSVHIPRPIKFTRGTQGRICETAAAIPGAAQTG